MSVINMSISYYMDKFSHLHVIYLSQYVNQSCILTNIPVICSKYILGTLI